MGHLPRLAFLTLFFSFFGALLEGQESLEYSERADLLFKQGIEQFSTERFDESVESFDRIIRQFPFNQRTTASFVMKAKALFMLNKNLGAARTLNVFLSKYPTSKYVADAEFTLGLVHLRIRRYDDAVQSMMNAWRKTPQTLRAKKLERDILAALDGIIDAYLEIEAVKQLMRKSRSVRERAFFWLKVGEKEAKDGKIADAAIAVDTLIDHYPQELFADRVAALRARVEQRGSVKLGALLPLMKNSKPSPTKELGTEIYDGIVFALDEYLQHPSVRVKVTLVTRDTERDPLVATRGTDELTSDDEIIGIIGPVFSSTTSAAVGLANARGVPLVTPTANSNGIAAVGRFIFQANPDYETRGRAMARYAVNQKGLKNLAILAPIDTYAKFMAEAFASEALRLGANLLGTEWYERGTSDFKIQLANLRKAGMLRVADPVLSFAGKLNREDIAKLVQLGVSLETIDSLIEGSHIVDAKTLLGPHAKQQIDSLGIEALYSDPRLDSLEYPVLGIDGFYVPLSAPEEIGLVSSQLVYFNFQTELLGSGEWNNFSNLNANKRYCDGVIFESDNFVHSDSSSYVDFFNRFYLRFKKRPTKYTLYGYDTAKLMLSLIYRGASSRDALARALTEVRDYRGLHSRIGFSQKRVNPWLQILQYKSDKIQLIDELMVE
ncbi:MAG: ABC transporter substrate-binding protein [Ignavibacteria bacterium]|nr:ABC transporter substrate-binding protein [Ignavibacteria bacterium]